MRAHRVSYFLAYGNLPGEVIRHRCSVEGGIAQDNRLCVNPAHLRSGSHWQNHCDLVASGAFVPPPLHRGTDVHTAKLTPTLVREIRRRYAKGGVTQRVLSKEYGVHRSTVTAIVSRSSWSHID